jgi:hypothetical protein
VFLHEIGKLHLQVAGDFLSLVEGSLVVCISFKQLVHR